MHFEEEFQRARQALGYPPIERVEYNPNISSADLDFSRNEAKVVVNPAVAGTMSPEARTGLYMHVLGHYTGHPYDAVTVLRELRWLTDFDEPELIREHFDDIVNNLILLSNDHPEVAAAYREEGMGAPVHEIVKKYLEEVSGEDFGAQFDELQDDQQAFVNELFRIDFLDRDNLKRNLRRFARAFTDLVGDIDPTFGNDYGLSSMNAVDVERALQDMAEELSPEEYEDLAETVADALDRDEEGEEDDEDDTGDEDADEGDAEGTSGIGRGSGTLDRLNRADVSYYENLSANYSLRLRGPETRRGGTYPSEIAPFRLGDSVADFDPVNSYGKLIPGVAKKWRREGYEVHGDAEQPPDALIVIDASGSMPDPRRERSSVVLGGFCAANAYLERGSSVAVANFGDVTLTLDFTRDRDAIYEHLCIYQGGGTTLRTATIERLERNRPDLHTIVITDIGLDNFPEVTDYLLTRKRDVSKTTLIWSAKQGFRPRFDHLSDTVTGYEVQDEADIPGIVLGEI